MAADDFANKLTADEQKALKTHYDGNAAQPLSSSGAPGEFYSHSVPVALFDQREPELATVVGMPRAERQQLRSTIASIARDTQLPDVAVAKVVDALIDTRVAGTRVLTDAEAEADEVARLQQIQKNNEELREQFAKHYGAKDGEQLLERTQRFVRSHPKLAAILKENGIGSRPEIVEAIAAHVFSNGIR